MGFLMPPHPSAIQKIQKYFKNDPRINGDFSRNKLPKEIKDGAYVINLEDHIGCLYFVTEMKLFSSIVLVLNMFLKRLKKLLEIKT